MNRKETTKFLANLLESKVLYPFGKHWASEVVLDFGREDLQRRVDYLLFEPAGATYISDIEKGIFTAYEIKSCKDDVYSGNGLNFVAEKNYIVTTMECWKDLQKDLLDDKLQNHIDSFNKKHITNWGVMVAVPDNINVRSTDDIFKEYTNPTKLSSYIDWKFYYVISSSCGKRIKPMNELLFCMLRSNGHPYLENDYLNLKLKVEDLEKKIKENYLYEENKYLKKVVETYKNDIAELAEENRNLQRFVSKHKEFKDES